MDFQNVKKEELVNLLNSIIEHVSPNSQTPDWLQSLLTPFQTKLVATNGKFSRTLQSDRL